MRAPNKLHRDRQSKASGHLLGNPMSPGSICNSQLLDCKSLAWKVCPHVFVVQGNVFPPLCSRNKVTKREDAVIVLLDNMVQVVTDSRPAQVVKDWIEESRVA